MAILAAIALPNYQNYARRANESEAQQEVQRISVELEKWKSRNFNYQGYNLPANTIKNYVITVESTERTWSIVAKTTQPKNYSFVATNSGLRCKKVGTTITVACAGADPW